MHAQTFFASLACLLSLTFAAAQAPDFVKTVADVNNPASVPASLTNQNAAQTTPTATPEAPDQNCRNPYEVVLEQNGPPYLLVTVEGRQLKLAIALGEQNTFLFSEAFCTKYLGKTVGACLGASPTPGEAKQGPFRTGGGNHDFALHYSERKVQFTLGPLSSQPIAFGEFAIREVLMVGGDPAKLVEFNEMYKNADGILGLSKSSELLNQLVQHSETCNTNMEAGFGIHLAPGGTLVFGGLDAAGSRITELDSSDIIAETSRYENSRLLAFNNSRSGTPAVNDPLTVVFDSSSPSNTVPVSVVDRLRDHKDKESAIAIEISGAKFFLEYKVLIPDDTIRPADDISFGQISANPPPALLVLGAPFFQYVYAAQIPGRSGLSFSPDTNDPAQKDIQSFSNIPAYSGENRETTDDKDDADDDEGAPGAGIAGGTKGDDDRTEATLIKPANNIGLIVGGVVGGVVVLAIIIFGVCFYRKKKLGRSSSRSIEKEYEADFDAEIGHDVSILQNFTKESGYAHLPTPPPPPPSSRTYADSQYLHPSTEYLPPIRPYSDESPLRSNNGSPAPLVAAYPVPVPTERSPFSHEDDSPLRTHPEEDNINHRHDDRRVSVARTVSSITDIPSPMISRNVSTASRRDYPSISQIQTRGGTLPRHDEDDDDDDAVSVRSGPGYQYRSSAPAAPPRLPFTRPENERSDSPL